MERDYIIKRNPMKKIRQLKYNRQSKVFLSDEDLKKLLTKMDKSYFTEHRDYRSTPKDCVNCPCKAKCGANEKGQKLYTAHIDMLPP